MKAVENKDIQCYNYKKSKKGRGMNEEFKLKTKNRILKMTTMLNIIMLVVLCWFNLLVIDSVVTFCCLLI